VDAFLRTCRDGSLTKAQFANLDEEDTPTFLPVLG